MERDDLVVLSPEHQSPSVSCLWVACVAAQSSFALQFALPDLKIALVNTPSLHPLFVLCCMVHYKRVRQGTDSGHASSTAVAQGQPRPAAAAPQGEWVGVSDASEKFVYLKLFCNFGPFDK